MKSKVFISVCLLLANMLLGSCGQTDTQFNIFAMDTLLTVSVSGAHPDFESECEAIVSTLENRLSAELSDSEVARFNRAERSGEVSEVTETLAKLSESVWELSGGAFDITVRPLVRLWDISHASDDWTPPSDAEISALLPLVGAERLTIGDGYLEKSEPGLEIDLGGVGKGWAVGELAAYLNANIGDDWGTLSFGGNVAVIGDKPSGDFVIGIKNPSDPGALIAAVEISSGIIAVSGGYERYVDYGGVRYQHIIDPFTGYPSRSEVASAAVWVDQPTPEAGALADALSTALIVMGGEASLDLIGSERLSDLAGSYGCEVGAVLIFQDGSIFASENLKVNILNK